MNDAKFDNQMTIIAIIIIMITIGILGNILNLIVLSRKSMRNVSTFRFLLYLSIIDLLVLSLCSSDALMTFGFNFEIRLISTAFCRLHTFLTYYLTQASSVILIGVSIERALAVCGEKLYGRYSNGQLSTRKFSIARRWFVFLLAKPIHVELAMFIIMTLLALINSHFLFYLNINSVASGLINITRTDFTLDEINFLIKRRLSFFNETFNAIVSRKLDALKKDDVFLLDVLVEANKIGVKNIKSDGVSKLCFPKINSSYFTFLSKLWTLIDLSLYCLIPFIAMLACTIIVAIEVKKKSFGEIKDMITTKTNRLITQKRNRKNNRIFLMLITTNLYFFLCSFQYFILTYNIGSNEEQTSAKYSLIVHILAYSNNSFNFVFYGLFSQKYRDELSKLIFSKTFSQQIKRKSQGDERFMKMQNKQMKEANHMKAICEEKQQRQLALDPINLNDIETVFSRQVSVKSRYSAHNISFQDDFDARTNNVFGIFQVKA